MKVCFQSSKFAKAANSESQGNRLWGARAAKVRQRLLELSAAKTLADVSRLPPPRCHQLHQNLDELFAVDVSANTRLVFRIDHEPIPQKKDGGIDLTKVTAVVVLGIEDYHGQ
jgi:plasmid maintenance system killer protein